MEKIFLEHPWIIVLILLWTLPWKAAALWRAARRGHIGWFLAIIILNTLGILDILYIFFFSKLGSDKNKKLEKNKQQPNWENDFQREDYNEEMLQKELYQEENDQWEDEVKANQQDASSYNKKRMTII